MKGYSHIEEDCTRARVEGINASYKDLAEVCGRIRGKKADWAVEFLEGAAACELPVFFSRHNKKLGHRRELGGRKGRYPWKAAELVLKVLQSAMANGKVTGLAEPYTILVATANKKETFPRMAPKGRQARSFLVASRVEIVLKGQPVPKGVTVTPPAKKEARKEEKKEERKETKPSAPVVGEQKKEEPTLLKDEAKMEHEHKHELEKEQDMEKKRAAKPHQHGEYDTR